MNIEYGVVEELCLLENDSQISYGIAICCSHEEKGCFSILEIIGNITTDKEKLAELVHTCNRLKLSPVHLRDVIADFLIQ